MTILIEVKSETLTATEAAAMIAFLTVMHPTASVAAALEKATTNLQPPAAVAPVLSAGLVVPKPPVTAPTSPSAMADALMASEEQRVAATAAPLVNAPVAPNAGATTGVSNATALPPGEGGTWPRKNAHGVEVDSEGLPWDKRIHSDAKGTVKGGQWKLRRKVDHDLVASVKAELVQVMGAPPAGAIPMGAPAFPQVQVEGMVNVPPATTAPLPPATTLGAGAPHPSTTGPIVGTASPTSAGDFTAATFDDLMSRVVDLSIAGADPTATVAICQEFGLNQPREFAHRRDLIPAVMARLATLG
jgi:hypothetical protein